MNNVDQRQELSNLIKTKEFEKIRALYGVPHPENNKEPLTYEEVSILYDNMFIEIATAYTRHGGTDDPHQSPSLKKLRILKEYLEFYREIY
ncbi:MAG: hypothetical protein CL792_00980 [Chloroflexi bacterium]|nr:hypothetical protein [Chloroflexota bacterium]|tara:strand:- start:2915 stop:3187 length:273 start_codon:yes stop_codon:yes gene_type:complete